MNNEELPIGRLLGITGRQLTARIQRLLEDEGLTHAGWVVLQRLGEEDGLTVRELADLCFVSAPSITGVVDTLERDGFVVRRRMEADRRVVRLALTDAGRARLTAAKRVVRRTARSLFADLTPADEITVRRFLTTTLERLDALEKKESSS